VTGIPEDVDVAIIGAGPLGMALALALAGGPTVVLIDSRARGAWADDPRALALAHGSRQLLERLGAWHAAAATAIREIHVSQRGGFGRTRIDADDYQVPALGYVMRYRDLADALAARLQPQGLIAPCSVDSIEVGRERMTLMLTHNGARRCLRARLIVHADGMPEAGPEVKVRDYAQQAIVAEVRTSQPHKHRAWERFTADGPLALLPLGENYAVVFTVPTDKAAPLLALDDDGFLAALHAQFGQRVGFVASGPRASFPLALRVRRQITQPRQVWIGNSAQTLHPVSGQGFNLGLRDAWQLAAALLDAADPGAPATLAGYARGRQIDRRGSVAFTDGLVRIFSTDLPPLRLARGIGLLALDLCPPLRHFVAKRMIWGARAWP
jgi:2-octaprenyl-6-methoxyphenol hydroxylase